MKYTLTRNLANLPIIIARCLKWHIKYYFKSEAYPLACGLYITNNCNLKCSFCNIWRKSERNIISYTDAVKIIDRLADLKLIYLSITGGEPLLVNHIFDVLRYAKSVKIPQLHLVSNGYFLDEKIAVRLQETGLDEISISIDGREDYHDKNRCVNGAYKKAIAAIENLVKYAPKINIVLNSIFSPFNPDECLHVLELAKRYGIHMKVQLLNKHPVFNKNNKAIADDYESSLNTDQIKHALNTLVTDRTVVNSRPFLKNMRNFIFDKSKIALAGNDCIFGYHHIEILENGLLFPCLEGQLWENGYELKNSIAEVISSVEYKKQLESNRSCRKCQESYYVCYYEPRLNFPITNFIKNNVFGYFK